MSRNLTTMSIVVTLAILFGMLPGMFLGIWLYAGSETAALREEAILQGHAEYDTFSGVWQWRPGLRRPIHEIAPWKICPICEGAGEMTLPPIEELEHKIETEPDSKRSKGMM